MASGLLRSMLMEADQRWQRGLFLMIDLWIARKFFVRAPWWMRKGAEGRMGASGIGASRTDHSYCRVRQ